MAEQTCENCEAVFDLDLDPGVASHGVLDCIKNLAARIRTLEAT